MKLIDLTPHYFTHYLHARDPDAYFACCPDLFEHYFTYWADPDRPLVDLNRGEVERRSTLITDELPTLESAFKQHHLDTAELKVILFVGQNTSNGHTMLLDEEFVVWLPVETYASQLSARVFVAHEIAHALHYQVSPGFYFHSPSEKLSVMRQLITEGLATYISREVLGIDDGTALWADYLTEQQLVNWLRACQSAEADLRDYVRTRLTPNSSEAQLFMANDPNDIYKYRAGYYLGLRVVEQLAGDLSLSLHDLLVWPHAIAV